MATHWSDKRKAQATVGDALAERGWKLWGYRPDRSDSMSDYYCPASWDGVATHDGRTGVVVVVLGNASDSGKVERIATTECEGKCAHCDRRGIEPALADWTLDRARANPRAYHRARLLAEHPGAVPLLDHGGPLGAGVKLPNDESTIRVGLSDVVSPIGFLGQGWGAGAPEGDDGDAVLERFPESRNRPRCQRCSGHGVTYRHGMRDGDTWPTFTGTARGGFWHVERGGRIIAKGRGLAACASWNTGRQAAEKIADEIEAALATKGAAPTAAPALPIVSGECDGAAFRVSPGLYVGRVEVRFAAKPSEETRATLKAAGFRWHGASGCWYGKAERLPAAFAPEPAASEIARRDEVAS